MPEPTHPSGSAGAARARLLARFRDESAQPAGYVAMRCTEHAVFIMWAAPPAPACRVACRPSCEQGV